LNCWQEPDIPMPDPAPDPHWTRQRVRAARENGALLSVPPLADAPAVAERNRQWLSVSDVALLGKPLPELRRDARLEVAALTATDSAESAGMDSPWFVTGHQPALFHPGVWVKNFAASALARATRGVGLNLIVDNDVIASPGILVPAGDRTAPTFAPLLYDSARPAEVWEEASLRDRTLWDSFGTRVRDAMQPWGVEPLGTEYWEVVRACGARHLPQILTCARAGWERRWGAGNRELPVSKMCDTAAFRWFAVHLLQNLPAFHALHNQVLDEYRELNHVRSRTHPVPDLRTEGDRLEAPFWIWRAGSAKRCRLFARGIAGGVELSDGSLSIAMLSGDPEKAIGALARLSQDGWRVRSRALTTTLFARMFLADLFLHGIGGAKYDEMTDQLLARFYGLIPPAFLTLSGTLHLPLGNGQESVDRDEAVHRLRDLRQHPERHLGGMTDPEVARLLTEKVDLIAEQRSIAAARAEGQRGVPSRGSARSARLREITAQLAERCRPQIERAREALARSEQRARANAVLKSREFSYVLFPAELLRTTLSDWTGR
jgi:hypothetical protein